MAFPRPSNSDEILMQQSVQFADCLQDLKNLRKQLYSAADYFESSYHKDDHKQVVIESSKDYVAEALVSTVDHMGSAADKLAKFLDEKAADIASTTTRFSFVERRLHMFEGFMHLRGMARHSLTPDAPEHHKQYRHSGPGDGDQGFHLVYRNCVSCPQYDMINRSKLDNPFTKAFRGGLTKPQPWQRKGGVRSSSSGPSPNQPNFSFTRVLSSREAGRRSDSSPRFLLKRSGSAARRSVSPCHSMSKQLQVQWPGAGGTRIPASLRPESPSTRNFLKALLSIHHSSKEMARARRS